MVVCILITSIVYLQCFIHISGAHINPVITIAFALFGEFPIIELPIYIVAQLAGGTAGFGLLKVST